MWCAAHVNQPGWVKTQETLTFVLQVVHSPCQPRTLIMALFIQPRYFTQCVWPYLCMPLKKEEALDKTQTSPICISLRWIPISKQSKNQVLWQEPRFCEELDWEIWACNKTQSGDGEVCGKPQWDKLPSSWVVAAVILFSLLVAFRPCQVLVHLQTLGSSPNLVLFIISYQPWIIPSFSSPALAGHMRQHLYFCWLAASWQLAQTRNPVRPAWGGHCQGREFSLPDVHGPRCCRHTLSHRKGHTPRLGHRARSLQRAAHHSSAPHAPFPELETHLCKRGSWGAPSQNTVTRLVWHHGF